jgi:NTE family protein
MFRMNVAFTSPMRTLNLALQGGGSHGAFTWGVLDALLADERIAIEGLSGTSAGAVNAVALASGYAKGLAAGHDPRQSARDSLARVGHPGRHAAAHGRHALGRPAGRVGAR